MACRRWRYTSAPIINVEPKGKVTPEDAPLGKILVIVVVGSQTAFEVYMYTIKSHSVILCITSGGVWACEATVKNKTLRK